MENMTNLKILVVDDSDINLRIIDKSLGKLGYLSKCLDSGQKCMEEIYNEHYDMILLDHMMPEMDGVQVLTEMKEKKDHLCQDAKVVVLTANTGEGVKEQYLEIGFDDYLAKPVSMQTLEDIIQRQLKNNDRKDSLIFNGTETDSLVNECTMVASENVWDLSQHHIDTQTGIEFAGDDPEQYLAMIGIFAGDFVKRRKKLEDSMTTETLGDYAILVHGLKGNARTLGAAQLGELAYEEELAAKSGDLDFVQAHFDKLVQEWTLVVDGFEKLLSACRE